MNLGRGILRDAALALGLCSLLASAAPAREQSTPRPERGSLITERVDESRLVTLQRNTHPAANAQNDRGRVEDNLPLEHMMLQLRRSPGQERALDQLINELHDPGSPGFHHWLTAGEVGQRFGPPEQDIVAITGWLGAHGLSVNNVYPDRMTIDFSGNAGAIRSAFHTEIHRLSVNGVSHIANMSDPRIPAALAPAVAGVFALHDFRPAAMHRMRPEYTFSQSGSQYQALTPADLATIYNFNPLFQAGIAGQGQTIVVIEDSDLYSASDWTTFRSAFGLSSYPGTLTSTNPAPAHGTNNCTDPGVVVGGDSEVALDAEWATAAAPGAAIQVAACADTATTFGGLIALENLLTVSNPPAIVSISYGQCETLNGQAANAAFASIYQTAVVEGVSVFVAAGDTGAAGCDTAASATTGVTVSGWASTPYNVAVGGTDFSDTYHGTTSTYWSATNTSTYGSALSYIPEIPWDDSCASYVWYTNYSYSEAYGSGGFCNSTTAANSALGFLTTGASSGGPSNCATGNAPTGDVNLTCAGWPKPSWQSGVSGIPNDGVRDLPDISMFASDGGWGHFAVFCFSDPAPSAGGYPCTGAPSNWAGAGGTSFSTPMMAGIQALINQKTGQRWGNPNTVYYKLAAAEFAIHNRGCSASLGNLIDPNCIFHDIIEGDIAVDCSGTANCYGSSAGPGRGPASTVYGVLSVSSTALAPAFGATLGWDFATGLGSVNAANLVNHWSASPPAVAQPVQPVR